GGAELIIVDAASSPAAVGQLGEVVVCSPHLALGYVDAPVGAFVPDPRGRVGFRAYHTRDLGRLDPAGGVHLDGRLDRQVLVNGFRVAPEQVEAAALGQPYIEEALATLKPTPAGEVLALQVVAAAAPDPPSAADIRARLRAVLPPYAVPSDIRVVPRLGTDHNHKVSAAPEEATLARVRVPAGDGTPGAFVAELSHLVREVIGRDLREHENFLDGGLNSISLVRLHALVTQRLAVQLPVTALFEHPNLAALARYLARADAGDGDGAPIGRDGGPGRPAEPAAVAGPDAAQQRRQLRQRLYSDLGEGL
ncbi:MAG TPA: non-ribosomal peptide synthetase, partial [Actinomycetota bacterium]|nr:non-ribosomal peptide synthetase [Actinomycetota bacterium]